MSSLLEDDLSAFLDEVDSMPEAPAPPVPPSLDKNTKKRGRDETWLVASTPVYHHTSVTAELNKKAKIAEARIHSVSPLRTGKAVAGGAKKREAAGSAPTASAPVYHSSTVTAPKKSTVHVSAPKGPIQMESAEVAGSIKPSSTPVVVTETRPLPAHKKSTLRTVNGKVWKDPTLEEWPENDFRLFVGDLDKALKSEDLAAAFRKYKSFQKARVVCEKYRNTSRGYGFVSFLDPYECAAALKEMNKKWIGGRPISLKVDNSHRRDVRAVQKKEQKRKKFWEKLR
jgi:hypothetical protein